MTEPAAPGTFRLTYVPGVTPAKWVRIWRERLPDTRLELVAATESEGPRLVRGREVDAGLLRLPVDREGLNLIALYEETPVVVVPKDHVITVADEVSTADLADEVLLHPRDEMIEWAGRPGISASHRPETTGEAIELVAAGMGVVVVPQSLARLHHRKDLTYRPVTDAPVSPIALAWPDDVTSDLVEEFIGIVRGRSVNSSRGRQAAPAPKRTAAQKAAAKRANRAAAAGPARASRPRRGRR